MFISSYNTYIDTSLTQRVQKERGEGVRKSAEPFSLKLTQPAQTELLATKKLPIDYISKYKVLNNKQEMEKQNTANNTPAKMVFSKIYTLSSAQTAYGENAKMFSLLLKPKPTLSQTPKLDNSLPQDAQSAQVETMKKVMVNAYVANDNYYRITAA